MKKKLLPFMFVIFFVFNGFAQNLVDFQKDIQKLQQYNSGLDHRLDQLSKQLDDLMWQQKVGDIAFVDKLYICGPAKWKEKNPDAMGAGNPLKFWTYVFIPLNIDLNKKYPLIVLPHGGVHADFTTYYAHIIRELISQGYVVVTGICLRQIILLANRQTKMWQNTVVAHLHGIPIK